MLFKENCYIIFSYKELGDGMNKILLSLIILLVGLLSGYCFIIFAGYTSAWSVELLIIAGNILKKYELLCLLRTVRGRNNLSCWKLIAHDKRYYTKPK